MSNNFTSCIRVHEEGGGKGGKGNVQRGKSGKSLEFTVATSSWGRGRLG